MYKKVRRSVETVLIAGILAAIVLMLGSVVSKHTGSHFDKTVYLEKNWYYMEDGKKTEVEFPFLFQEGRNRWCSITTVFRRRQRAKRFL